MAMVQDTKRKSDNYMVRVIHILEKGHLVFIRGWSYQFFLLFQDISQSQHLSADEVRLMIQL